MGIVIGSEQFQVWLLPTLYVITVTYVICSTITISYYCSTINSTIALFVVLLYYLYYMLYVTDPVAPLVTYTVSCRTAFKWCEFDPRHAQQLFGTPFSEVALL